MPDNTETNATTIECPFLDPDVGLFERTKVDLLRHYATKEPRHFYQIDGFYPSTGALDDLQDPDGDELIGQHTFELMNGASAVRVLATPGADPGVVARILRKAADGIERDPISLSKWGSA